MTFIVDNGADAQGTFGRNWPYRGEKGTYWEGGLRVPAFVAGPLIKRPGYTNQQLFHVTDWYPTLLQLAGVPLPHDLDGYPMWDVIR